jgi:hypothetical protein
MDSKYTIDQIPIELHQMNSNSRVWIWPASRELNGKEGMQVSEYLRQFTQDWTSHNHELKAFATMFYNRFIVIFLDEAASTSASGCSIDKMTHSIQYLSDQLDLNLLDRTHFQFLINNQVEVVPISDLTKRYSDGVIDNDSLVFDHLVKDKDTFFNNWLKPFKSSWHFRFI